MEQTPLFYWARSDMLDRGVRLLMWGRISSNLDFGRLGLREVRVVVGIGKRQLRRQLHCGVGLAIAEWQLVRQPARLEIAQVAQRQLVRQIAPCIPHGCKMALCSKKLKAKSGYTYAGWIHLFWVANPLKATI